MWNEIVHTFRLENEFPNKKIVDSIFFKPKK